MGKQRYQTGRAVVLLLRHGDKDGIVRDNVLRMLCSRLFSPDLQGYLRLLRSPPDILPLCSGEHLELTRFTISAAFPHPPFPIGGIRGRKGRIRSVTPRPLSPSFPFHPAFIFFLIRRVSCNSHFWPCLGLFSVEMQPNAAFNIAGISAMKSVFKIF